MPAANAAPSPVGLPGIIFMSSCHAVASSESFTPVPVRRSPSFDLATSPPASPWIWNENGSLSGLSGFRQCLRSLHRNIAELENRRRPRGVQVISLADAGTSSRSTAVMFHGIAR